MYADQLKKEGSESPHPKSKNSVPETESKPVSEQTGTDVEIPEKKSVETAGLLEEEAVPAETPIPYEPYDSSLLSTSALSGICASSPGILWAVGDRGTVWTTLNGGEKWLLVRVPTRANLYSVSFSSSDFGLIVGGSVIPGTPNGRGIILRTEDGGRTWTQSDTLGFPILRKVLFSEDGTAEAWGDSSELYPAGHFISTDRGETWESAPKTNRHSGWKAAVRITDRLSVGIGTDGTSLCEEGSNCTGFPAFSESLYLTDIAAAENTLIWSGYSGTLLSGNGSETPSPLPLPPDASGFDFETVSVQGTRICAAGSPGTRVFSSGDAGKTWQSSTTGITVPIRKILFTDDQNGWGVGELGNIIATHDGGKTWQVQREGGRRAAWFGVCENGDLLPFEWLAVLSAKDGWFGVTDQVTRPVSGGRFQEILPEHRERDAVIAAGGSASIQETAFPVPSPEAALPLEVILSLWNSPSDSSPDQLLRKRLVQQIRTWRPTLLIIACDTENTVIPTASAPRFLSYNPGVRNPIKQTAANIRRGVDPIKLALMVEQTRNDVPDESSNGMSLSPFSEFLRSALLDAVRDAADPGVFPEQITKLGLPTWKTERIGILRKNAGTLKVKTTDYISLFRESAEETVLRTQKIAGTEKLSAKNFRKIEMIFPANEPALHSASSPFAGLDIPPGTESRRPLPLSGSNKPETSAVSQIEERRRLLAIADHFTGKSAQNTQLLRGNINEALTAADSETAALFLLRLGNNLNAGGDPDSANELYERLLAEYPEEDAAREGALRLIRSYAGIERVRRVAEGRAVQNESGPISPEKIESKSAYSIPGIVNKSADAVRIGEIVRENYPELYMCPAFRFPLAAAQRRTGALQSALGYYYNRSVGAPAGDSAGLFAAGEYTLLNSSQESGKGESPLNISICALSAAVPYLDGILEPEIWRNAIPLSFAGNSGPNTAGDGPKNTSVSFLYDQENLYLAIVAQKESETDLDQNQPRLRDTDLNASDRIEIALDPDRDFHAFYKFIFDYRGWTADACQGDPDWNPRIFIANRETADSWILEMAIPWEELCDNSPAPGNVWGLALRRITPGLGIAHPGISDSPELEDSFEYLKFE